MHRAAGTVALLVALVAPTTLAGCAGDQDPGSLPGEPSSGAPSDPATTGPTIGPTTGPPTEPDPIGAGEVASRLARLETGHFLSAYELDGVRIVKDGVYRISDAASASDATVSLPDGSRLRLRSVVVDGATYGQVDNGGTVSLQQCWFRYDEGTAAGSGLAPEIGAVLSARNRQGLPQADLVTTASAFGSDFVANLGLTEELRARTPIELDFAGARLVGWRVSPTAVLDAARASGLSVPAAAYRGAPPLIVRLDRFGEPVDIEAPPPDRQVPFDPAASQAELDRAIEECESR